MVIRDGDGQGAPLRVVYVGWARWVVTRFQLFCQLVWYRYYCRQQAAFRSLWLDADYNIGFQLSCQCKSWNWYPVQCRTQNWSFAYIINMKPVVLELCVCVCVHHMCMCVNACVCVVGVGWGVGVFMRIGGSFLCVCVCVCVCVRARMYVHLLHIWWSLCMCVCVCVCVCGRGRGLCAYVCTGGGGVHISTNRHVYIQLCPSQLTMLISNSSTLHPPEMLLTDNDNLFQLWAEQSNTVLSWLCVSLISTGTMNSNYRVSLTVITQHNVVRFKECLYL